MVLSIVFVRFKLNLFLSHLLIQLINSRHWVISVLLSLEEIILQELCLCVFKLSKLLLCLLKLFFVRFDFISICFNFPLVFYQSCLSFSKIIALIYQRLSIFIVLSKLVLLEGIVVLCCGKSSICFQKGELKFVLVVLKILIVFLQSTAISEIFNLNFKSLHSVIIL